MFPLVSILMAFGTHDMESDMDRTTFFPHFPHLNNVVKELKCPRFVSGIGSANDTINLQNSRLWILSFLSFNDSTSTLVKSAASLEKAIFALIAKFLIKFCIPLFLYGAMPDADSGVSRIFRAPHKTHY